VAAWYVFIFVHKNFHKVKIFVNKGWNLPPCRRRIGPVVPADAWFGTDRISPVKEQNLRGSRANRAVAPLQNSSAGGSMILSYLFQSLSEKVVRVGHTACWLR
jgi:hypothetical protein